MFKTANINCNGLREPIKIEYLKSVIAKEKIDICFVQESHIDDGKIGKFVERKLNARTFWSYTENSKCKGVGIVINNSLDCKIVNIDYDPLGRYVCVDILYNEYDFRLVSIYAPNNEKDRKSFFQDIYKLFVVKKTYYSRR